MPQVWSQLSQAPTVKRAPERSSLSIRSPPKRTTVPGLPRMPAELAGLAVTSGGTSPFLIHHSRYSARAQTRPGGPQGGSSGQHDGCAPQQPIPSSAGVQQPAPWGTPAGAPADVAAGWPAAPTGDSTE
jgi:hypothetical protein